MPICACRSCSLRQEALAKIEGELQSQVFHPKQKGKGGRGTSSAEEQVASVLPLASCLMHFLSLVAVAYSSSDPIPSLVST